MKPMTVLAIAGCKTYFDRAYGIQGTLAEGISEGLLDPGKHSPGDVLSVSLTDAGRALLATSSPSDLGGPDDAWNRLWAYLLAHGGHTKPYTGLRPEACVHLAECGFDVAATTTPTDDSWTEFHDSFHEDSRHGGLSGKATCRCGAVRGVKIYAAYPETTLAGMIREATGDWGSFVAGV